MSKLKFKIGERYQITDAEGIEFPKGTLVKIVGFAFSNLAEVQGRNERGKLVTTLARLSQLEEYNKYQGIPKEVVDIVESFPQMLDSSQKALAKKIMILINKAKEEGKMNAHSEIF